jgi:hypothetical protein
MPRSDVFWDKSAPEWEPEEEMIVRTDSLVCRNGKWFKWNGQQWTQSEINPRTGKWRSVRPEETREERMERLTREEMKTRVIESQVDLLLGIIESYREGWKQ